MNPKVFNLPRNKTNNNVCTLFWAYNPSQTAWLKLGHKYDIGIQNIGSLTQKVEAYLPQR